METRYYYLRKQRKEDRKKGYKGRPVITVCLIQNKSTLDIGKGVAICSNSDNPLKKYGRKEAKKRAEMAHSLKKDSLPICRDRAWYQMFYLISPGELFHFKSLWNPELTDFEKKLFKK